jgi:hypothetical protein
VVILACAVSAGIHGALVPEHLGESTGAGAGFVAATVLPAALAALVTYRPTQPVLLLAGACFAGLVVAWVGAVTTGVPILHPEREAIDGLALFTKAVELAGLVAAAGLLRRPSRRLSSDHVKGLT